MRAQRSSPELGSPPTTYRLGRSSLLLQADDRSTGQQPLDVRESVCGRSPCGGLRLTTPLTSTILKTMPADRSGVASAVFNASREVAGLLGITAIGVVLRIRENAELHLGHAPVTAFLSGYRLGLVLAGLLVTAGAVAAWLSLRDAPAPAPKSAPAPRQPLASEA
jgi:hypothetical protein